jgi:hypothetical protein
MSRHLANPWRLVVVALALALPLSGCGNSEPTTPTPEPTPTPAARANVVLTLSIQGIETGTLAPYQYTLRFNVRLNETFGVPARLDFMRLDFFEKDGTLMERTQRPASDFPGNGQIPAKGVLDILGAGLGFSSNPTTGRYLILTFRTIDEKGFDQTLTSGRLSFG